MSAGEQGQACWYRLQHAVTSAVWQQANAETMMQPTNGDLFVGEFLGVDAAIYVLYEA